MTTAPVSPVTHPVTVRPKPGGRKGLTHTRPPRGAGLTAADLLAILECFAASPRVHMLHLDGAEAAYLRDALHAYSGATPTALVHLSPIPESSDA